MTDTASGTALPRAPFVGVRPFQRHEAGVFCGRDADAALLCDKVFSAALTVVYGPSGVGKSSLLRALVLPRLEDDGAHVVSFDNWRARDTVLALRDLLIDEARTLDIPNPTGGAPNLVELMRLLQHRKGNAVVLVLDQFEEFFTSQSKKIQLLSKALGSLVRAPNLDVRILISLREEHLASLEPFRADLTTLFQSTYRLSPLAETGVRKAIKEPIKKFRSTIEDDLVNALVADIAPQGISTKEAAQAGDGAVSPAPDSSGEAARRGAVLTADLPILQLLCAELWQKAVKPDGTAALTLELYRKAGGKEGILNAYLKRILPKGWRARYVTAQLMRHLAPPDGHKVGLSAEYLVSSTELSPRKVENELDRLSKVLILRTRSFGPQRVLYELWHDSYIRILAPWRDHLLRTARRAKRLGIAAGVALLVGASFWAFDRWELRANTVGVLGSGRAETEKLDRVASYLLLKRSGDWRLDRARALLEERAALIPLDYGVEFRRPGFLVPRETTEDWPLVLEYSAARPLNEAVFAQAWHWYAGELSEKWGVPVPMQLRLKRVATLPKESVRLLGPHIETLEFDQESAEQMVYVSSSGLSGPAAEFFNRFHDQWTVISWTASSEPHFVVPRWSVPAWKWTGVRTHDGSGLLAFRLQHELLREPQRLITPAMVDHLLARTAKDAPVTVAEARAARGARLARDLQTLLAHGRPIAQLATILDALAALPEASSEEAANVLMSGRRIRRDARLRGAHPSLRHGSPSMVDAKQVRHEAYVSGTRWLPESRGVEVNLGAGLVESWLTSDGWKREPASRMRDLNDGILRRYGVLLPSVQVRQSALHLAPNALRVVFLDQNPGTVPVDTADLAGAAEFDSLLARLAAGAQSYGDRFITAERVQEELDAMGGPIREWLRARYSVTDLKLLLRATLAGDTAHGPETTAATGATIRYPAWLLASLVFWRQVDHTASVAQHAEWLRSLQRQRLHAEVGPTSPANVVIASHIELGRRSLAIGNLAAAERHFDWAVATDAKAAIAAFVAAYPGDLPAQQVSALNTRCDDFRNPRMRAVERPDFEELARSAVIEDRTVTVAKARTLRLCLLTANAGATWADMREMASALAQRYGEAESWPPEQAAWFGEILVRWFGSAEDGRTFAQTGRRFLTAAMRNWEYGKEKVEQFGRIASLCQVGPSRPCWTWLPEVAAAAGEPQFLGLLAEHLARTESRQQLDLAIDTARRVRPKLAALEGQARLEWLDPLDLAVAVARSRRMALGQTDKVADIEASLRALQKSSAVGDAAVAELSKLLTDSNKIDEATRVIDTALRGNPRDSALLWTRMRVALVTGDRQRVAAVASTVHQQAGGLKLAESIGHRFYAALGLLITKSGPWERASREFMATNHEYVPYIAMMLYTRMSGAGKREAEDILKQRWGQARPRTWLARLEEGDVAVWREMLIGLYMQRKEVDVPRLFAVLQDERRFASSEFAKLPMSRQGMLCEAYFYDALLADAQRDRNRMRGSLQKAIDTGQTRYIEHALAKFLLADSI